MPSFLAQDAPFRGVIDYDRHTMESRCQDQHAQPLTTRLQHLCTRRLFTCLQTHAYTRGLMHTWRWPVWTGRLCQPSSLLNPVRVTGHFKRAQILKLHMIYWNIFDGKKFTSKLWIILTNNYKETWNLSAEKLNQYYLPCFAGILHSIYYIIRQK